MRGNGRKSNCQVEMNIVTKEFSGSKDSTVRVWDRKEGECLLILMAHHLDIYCIFLENQKLFSGSLDTEIR